jgi:hypothetical protein
MVLTLASLTAVATGASAIGLLLSMGTFLESESVSRSLRDCVRDPALRGSPVCDVLVKAVTHQSRSGGVVLAGGMTAACMAAAAFAKRESKG